MKYIPILNNYLEYSLDNHTVNLYFRSTSMYVFHAAVSIYEPYTNLLKI